MRRTMLKLASLHAMLSLCLWDAAGQAANGPAELTRAAQFVFRGTIQRVEASTLDLVPADSDTAVVRVDEVLKAAPSLGDFTGREITVKLAEPGDATQGEQAVFFTKGWLYGETLAVIEIGRLEGDAALLRAQVDAAVHQAADKELRGRLAGAALIVAGRVVDLYPAAVVGEVGEGSEHDPQWWEAVVQVDTVFRGKPAGQRITFLFPASQDVVWAEAPKPAVGWDGIWLLYRDQLPELSFLDYTALKPWNLVPRGQADRVRRLLGP
jgi:hypothetical protein